MRIVVSTHQGKLYDEEVDYVVVHNQDGEFAMLKDHIPVISVINEGYVKMVTSEVNVFVAVYQGVLEFHDNFVSVLAQEAYAGKTSDEAFQVLTDLRAERRNLNRVESSDFTQKEKELRDNLAKSKAGSL